MIVASLHAPRPEALHGLLTMARRSKRELESEEEVGDDGDNAGGSGSGSGSWRRGSGVVMRAG